MQISITNGTLTQIQETLTADSGYTLPTTISVSGATSNYSSTTGAITLTNLTQTMSITATGESQATGISNIFFGNSQMASAYYGNSEVASIWYGNTKVYEKGGASDIELCDYDIEDGSFIDEGDEYEFADMIYYGFQPTLTKNHTQAPNNEIANEMMVSSYQYINNQTTEVRIEDYIADNNISLGDQTLANVSGHFITKMYSYNLISENTGETIDNYFFSDITTIFDVIPASYSLQANQNYIALYFNQGNLYYINITNNNDGTFTAPQTLVNTVFAIAQLDS